MPAEIPDRDDERFAALFGAARRSEPATDREFLDRLRERTTEEFLAAAPVMSSAIAAPARSFPAPQRVATSSSLPSERRPMLLPLAVRAFAAMVAFALFTTLALLQSPNPPVANTRLSGVDVSAVALRGTTLGGSVTGETVGGTGAAMPLLRGNADLGPALATVFELAANHDSLHLQVDDNGLQRDIFASNGNLRVESPNGDVQLLLGNNLWSINEARNTAQCSVLPADNGTLANFMRVLDVPPESPHEMAQQKQQLAMAYPLQVNDPQGNPQLLYETQVNTRNQFVDLEVTVDPKSKALQRVVTRYLPTEVESMDAPEPAEAIGGVRVKMELASKDGKAVDGQPAVVEDATEKVAGRKTDRSNGVSSGLAKERSEVAKLKAPSKPAPSEPPQPSPRESPQTQNAIVPPLNAKTEPKPKLVVGQRLNGPAYSAATDNRTFTQARPDGAAPTVSTKSDNYQDMKSGENKNYAAGPTPKTGDQNLRKQNYQNYRTQTVVALDDKVVEKLLNRQVQEVAANELFGNKFVVKDTLTEDGRIGKIIDVQGVAGLRPASHERWTPVTGKPLLRLGDQVRTDARGANAVGLKLVKNTSVTVGPGTLVELLKPDQIRLFYGQLEIAAEENAPVSLLGPGKEQLQALKTAVYAVQNEKLVRLENPDVQAKWLAGFKGTAVQESLGSLLAKPAEPGTPDTRMTPLTVGYHKVTVDIRDQIARTVVEESFINHTPARLEGVFYFPLPQDASISGFAMWIGNDLVEADVVEKQRAREIYETILREKRDPGLLEWTGGNIFKARVFPIEGHSEKRIRITYTQVLPLRGNSYRYSYALQSELLRQHPLRDLGVQVQVQSTLPLKAFTCPTHTARVQATPHAAQAEYSVQDHTPTRDFEVVVQLDTEQSRQNDLVLIPHRRGDDGYFLLQITPPAEAQWERDVLPNGGSPLPLVILADTSASMDATSRIKQGEVVAGLLGALTPNDTFNLGCCDVQCEWAFAEPVSATRENVAASRKTLEQKASLGWTDLDETLGAALKMADQMSPAVAQDKLAANQPVPQIVYVGDGIPTTRDANPQAAADRLRALYAANPHGVLHAISVGSSYESGILQTLAALNGGTVRHVDGEHGPQVAAFELLNELERPGLRDMQVEFHGIRTARVYPRTLPSLPPGSQQIILGRYLPQGTDQAGEVVVTAKQGTMPVSFRAKVSLKDAEHGNEFIPRLWARMHLDSLLEQGQAQAIRDEVISLSEEFNIITPYTSLLVLESDADRERFKVQRRFKMRDGEKYFQEGRDDASFALVQQQMQQAGAWRLNLRNSVLHGLGRMGRDPNAFDFLTQHHALVFNSTRPGIQPWGRTTATRFRSNLSYSESGPQSHDRLESLAEDSSPVYWDFNGDRDDSGALGINGPMTPSFHGPIDSLKRELADGEDFVSDGLDPWGEFSKVAGEKLASQRYFDESDAKALAGEPLFGTEFESFAVSDRRGLIAASKPRGGLAGGFGSRSGGGFGGGGFGFDDSGRGAYPYVRQTQPYGLWVDQYFPPLANAPTTPEVPAPSLWPAEFQTLAQTLVRTPTFAKLAGGLEVNRVVEYYTPRGELVSQSGARALVGPQSWAKQTSSPVDQTLVDWCDPQERGVMSLAYSLGRVRTSVPAETTTPPLDLHDYSMTSLALTYSNLTPTVEALGADRVRLRLVQPEQSGWEMSFVIDTARHVTLENETRVNAATTARTTFGDFVEAGGSWWPARTEVFDAKGRRTRLTTLTVKPLDAGAYTAAFKEVLATRTRSFLISESEIPEWADALRRTAAGQGKLLDHLPLLLNYESRQQWTKVFEEWSAIEKLAGDKPGLAWVRRALQQEGRRHAELKQDLLAYAQQLVAQPVIDDLFLANATRGVAGSIMTAQELLGLHALLKPVYDRQPAVAHAPRSWMQLQAGLLSGANRPDQALALNKVVAEGALTDVSLQTTYVQDLVNAGDSPAGLAWSEKLLQGGTVWEPSEEAALRLQVVQQLETEGRYADEVTYLTAWMARSPENSEVYTRHLAALVRLDRLEEAYKTIDDWMAVATPAQPLDPATAKSLPVPGTAAAAKLSAAVHQALGQGHNLYSQWIDPRFGMPLAKAALVLGRNEAWGSLAQQISSGRLEQTDGYVYLLQQATVVADAEVETLPPATLNRFVGWMLSDQTKSEDLRNRVLEKLRVRWQAATKADEKWQLGSTYGQMVRNFRPSPEVTAFYRLQLETASAKHRSQALQELYNHLAAQDWSDAVEQELFALLPKLSSHDPNVTTDEQLRLRLVSLLRLVDKLVQNRYAVARTAAGRLDELTRTQLAEKQNEWQNTALKGVADRLNQERAKLAPMHATLAAWMNAERLVLEFRLQRDLDKLAGECWEQLPAQPFGKAGEATPPTVAAALDRMLQERMVSLLAALAARPAADVALVERFQKYVDAGMAAEGDGMHWKAWKLRLLIALDKPKDLEAVLRQWMQNDPDQTWQTMLGYLLAEQGKLEDAVRLFETARERQLLGPHEHQVLAGWYQVLNKKAEAHRSRVEAMAVTQEYYLNNALHQRLYRLQNPPPNSVPTSTQAGEQDLLMFGVLFEKSQSPANYTGLLQGWYQSTRDFRLLTGLADAVVGHTAGKAYPLLENISTVLTEMREEATADQLVAHIATVRGQAKTEVNQRVLDLLEALVERRASEVQNQGGAHAAKALAAMEQAYRREWSEGERRLMAELLAGLGIITQPALAKEQLRELDDLHKIEPVGTIDHLGVSVAYARALGHYDRRQDGIDLLAASLKAYSANNGDVLASPARFAIEALVAHYETQQHFADGERYLLDLQKQPLVPDQKYWAIQRLFSLYQRAVDHDSTVSLGTGQDLYRSVLAAMRQQLDTADHGHRAAVVRQFCELYRIANGKKYPTVAADLDAFSKTLLPGVLLRQTNEYSSLVSQVAEAIREISGPVAAIDFVVTRIEHEPRWFEWSHQSGWQQNAYRLAYWGSEEAKWNLPAEVSQRLLKIVLRELKEDLETRTYRNPYTYRRNYGYFWEAKAGAFMAAAEEVYARHEKSEPHVLYIAEYLFNGLARGDRAIEILFVADGQKQLSTEGQARLVNYLHDKARYGESVALLQRLIAANADSLQYRVQLMRALFHTNRKDELQQLLTQTHAHFHLENRWSEGVMAELGSVCLHTQLFAQSVAYFKEAISLRERTAPNRGIGDGTLSSYYGQQASAYAGLKQTPEAVDAAMGAVVSWGHDQNNRRYAVDALRHVLEQCPDLKAYIAHLDQQISTTKADRPLVRKTLGRVLKERGQLAEAVTQYKLATELEPNDAESQKELIACYEALMQPQLAASQTLAAIRLLPRELDLYKSLGDKFKKLERTADAERAWTSMVEMQANESESHMALAQLRQEQNRWPEAIDQWQRVAVLRELEPTGLLGLAAAQLHERRLDATRETLRKLRAGHWPQRFNAMEADIQRLEQQLQTQTK